MDDILVFRTGVLGTLREKFAGVAATGRTIGEEILERRLAAACDLLKAGRNSVAAVAGFCGWNGDVAFRKAFKSRFGAAPLRWARGPRNARAP